MGDALANYGYGHMGFFLDLLHIHGAIRSADILGGTQADIFAGDVCTGACGEDAAVLHFNAHIAALGLDVLGGEIAVTVHGNLDIAVIVDCSIAGADTDFHMERSGIGIAGIVGVCFFGNAIFTDFGT